MKTDLEGLEAIKIAMSIAPNARMAAITRLFAISMVFYREPVGDRAQAALHELMDVDSVSALFFLTGFAIGANGAGWERLAFPNEPQGTLQTPASAKPTAGRPITDHE